MTTTRRGPASKESTGKEEDKESTKTKKETSKKAAASLVTKAAAAAAATTTTAAAAAAAGAASSAPAPPPRRGRSSAVAPAVVAAPLPPKKKAPAAATKIAPATRTLGGKSTSRVAAVSQASSGSDDGSGEDEQEVDEEEDLSDDDSGFEPELGSDSTPSGSDSSEIDESSSGDDDDDEASSSDDGEEEREPKAAAAAAAAGAAPGEPENRDDANDNDNDDHHHHHSDSDSSDGGRPQRNTAGDVPLEWYRAEDHVGYDVDGRRLGRRPRKDALDALLERADGGAALRTIYDEHNDEDIVLTRDEVRMVTNIRRGAFPHVGLSAEAGGGIDPFEPEDDYYTRHRLVSPINAAPEPKRRFMPSKWEDRAVVKLVRALRKGWIKPRDKDAKLRDPEAEMFGGPPRDFLMWGDDGSLVGSDLPGNAGIAPLPAPKVPLPGHGDSYNPPAEYLAIEEEKEKAEKKEEGEGDDEIERKKTFFDSLRSVPAYADFVRERFERCLDLYLCPRAKKRTPHVDDAATLLPDLPAPQDLRPFPRRLAARLRDAGSSAASGDAAASSLPPLRGVALDPRGQWVAAAGDAGVVAFWDARTGRLAGRVDLNADGKKKGAGGDDDGKNTTARVGGLSWRPGPAGSRAPLLAAAVGDCIVLLAPPETVCTPAQREGAEEALKAGLEAAARARKESAAAAAGAATPVGKWSRHPSSSSSASSPSSSSIFSIDLGFRVKHLAWHAAGDYLVASTAAPGGARTVSVHRLSTGASQAPFRKLKGGAPGPVAFHPTRPALLLACGAHVRVYDLAAQALEKKLVGSSGGGGAAALAVHPRGEHVAVGGGDGRLAWYDLDLSPRPFRALRYHARGVRGAAFHPTHPLLATAGDDGAAHVLHGAVYNDLVTPPLIVPLKVLPAHSVVRSDGCLALTWHPTQPWLYTVGGDGCLCIWVDN